MGKILHDLRAKIYTVYGNQMAVIEMRLQEIKDITRSEDIKDYVRDIAYAVKKLSTEFNAIANGYLDSFAVVLDLPKLFKVREDKVREEYEGRKEGKER